MSTAHRIPEIPRFGRWSGKPAEPKDPLAFGGRVFRRGQPVAWQTGVPIDGQDRQGRLRSRGRHANRRGSPGRRVRNWLACGSY